MAAASTVTAEVVAGKKTNRIKKVRRHSTETSPQRGLVRYRKDPKVANQASTIISVSIPVAALADIDALCARVTMSRSQFFRQASVYFAAYLGEPSVHHRAVHEEPDIERVARELRALRVDVRALGERLEKGSR